MTRQELYELVWTMPVIHAARSVGLSDKGLAKKCKTLDVPMPPRGYWARVSAGAEIPRPPLLESSNAEALVRKVLSGLKVAGVGAEPSSVGQPDCKPVATGPGSPSVRSGKKAPPLDASSVGLKSAYPSSPGAAWPPPPTARTAPPPGFVPAPSRSVDIDLELVRGAAADFQGLQAIRGLLQAVSVRAAHARPEEARCILQWVGAVRVSLDALDPVDALIRLAVSAHL